MEQTESASDEIETFVVSFEAMEVLTEEEISELLLRHREGDPGESAGLDQGELGFESLFIVRGIRTIVYTDADHLQTNVWLEHEWAAK
ncbi:MAG: hypothetical protein L0Z50_37095 [Verrucomicrobiales bacterium]|nr:hypothetical protein [Verrucomicrobiales bacterium]